MSVMTVRARTGAPGAQYSFGSLHGDCLVGRSGVVPAGAKIEGDGATPLGAWQILYGLYRPDRVATPPTARFAWRPLTLRDGWCDAPGDPLYNQPCPKGYRSSHEELWRADRAYDYILVIDHNIPAAYGLGSAIFIHVWSEGATRTAGCVALKPAELFQVIADGLERVIVELADA